tara:strand:+ start:1194 stop:1631 length:438 start_codon:yes stop_codon:yes gene_type:complete
MSSQQVIDKIDSIEDPEEVRRQQAQQLIDLEQVIPGVSPGAVLDAMDDPEAFAAIARGDLYVQLAVLRQQMAHPKTSMNQRLEYTKFLAKMGKVDAPEKDGGGFSNVPMISIVMPGSGGEVRIGAAKPSPVEREVNPGVTKAVLP